MTQQDDDLQNYQDETDTDEHWTDRATEELTDDPSEELGVPASELKTELDHTAFENGDDHTVDDDDEAIDDRLNEDEDSLDDEGGNDGDNV